MMCDDLALFFFIKFVKLAFTFLKYVYNGVTVAGQAVNIPLAVYCNKDIF